MGIEVTREAAEVLRRSLELGGVDPAGAGGVRLRGSHGLGGGFDIQVELAEKPLEGEEVVVGDGVRLFVDPRVTESIPDAVVAVEPQHQTIVVRPADPSSPG
jgi:Fe-S cluster assembly iron-binding protein IscA